MEPLDLPEPGLQHVTKATHIAEYLRDAILDGRLQPGQRLLLRELEAQLGASITPIREALKQLEAEGLVESVPYKGMFVARFDVRDAVEIYDLRAVLEAHAVALAAPNLTPAQVDELERLTETMAASVRKDPREMQLTNREFHQRLWTWSGSRRLFVLCNDLWRMFPWSTLRRAPARPEASVREHYEILAALRRGDAQAAAAAMNHHIREALKACYFEPTETDPARSDPEREG